MDAHYFNSSNVSYKEQSYLDMMLIITDEPTDGSA